MIQFSFYLDAWRYCQEHRMSAKNIVRVDWDTWAIPKRKKKKNVHKQRQATSTESAT